jgi:hypothetical protein
MAKKKASTAEKVTTPENSEFEIESGIEIPERQPKYPFCKLEIGESFFIPGKTKVQFVSTAHTSARRVGIRVRVWDAEKDSVQGVRVGRVS